MIVRGSFVASSSTHLIDLVSVKTALVTRLGFFSFATIIYSITNSGGQSVNGDGSMASRSGVIAT
jgi:hypothetical protein